jgi:hypothetical protein
VSRALDPTDLGRPWRVTTGRIDHVLLLAPRDDGLSRLEPLPRTVAVRRLIDQSFADAQTVGPGRRGRLVAALCDLVNGAECWSIVANHPADVIHLLRDMLAAGARPR